MDGQSVLVQNEELPPSYEDASSHQRAINDVRMTATASAHISGEQRAPLGSQASTNASRSDSRVVVVTSAPAPSVTGTVLIRTRSLYAASNMRLSVMTLIFCLFPIGIVAVIFSYMSYSSYEEGDEEKGRANAKVALVINVVNVIAGILFIILYITVIHPAIVGY